MESLLKMKVSFLETNFIYEVENFKEINYQLCGQAMAHYQENLDYKKYLGPVAYRRLFVLPNSAYNTYMNQQTFIK